MKTVICNACGKAFTPRPQTPHQKYCSCLDCQRQRRRIWQQERRKNDSDYRENDIRVRKAWNSEHQNYWKRYREEHPVYAERNRTLQQKRNKSRQALIIANEDVSRKLFNLPGGIYRMVRVLENGTPQGNTWIVQVTTVMVIGNDEDA